MAISAFFALLIIVILGYGVLTGVGVAAYNSVSSDGDNVTSNPNAPAIQQQIVPTNPSTWPSGDRIWDCCRAIAFAEGYNVAGSVPARLNNPGDLSDGMQTFGSEFHSGSNVTKFPTAVTGWTWLYAKLRNAITGVSSVYSGDMSWRDIGRKWAGNSDAWTNNVTTALGVSPDSTLNDYVNG